MPDPNWWNAGPGELRSDREREPRDGAGDTPPLDRCAWCGVLIDRVSVAVVTSPYTSVVCCGDTCCDELLARLGTDR